MLQQQARVQQVQSSVNQKEEKTHRNSTLASSLDDIPLLKEAKS